MPVLKFVINVEPRTVQHGARRSRAGHFYNDGSKKSYFEEIARECLHLAPGSPLTGPVALGLTFYLPRPKRLLRRCDAIGAIPHDKHPDRANLYKGTEDALGKCGFWVDDKQVYSGTLEKYYVEKELHPRIEVTIEYDDRTDNTDRTTK